MYLSPTQKNAFTKYTMSHNHLAYLNTVYSDVIPLTVFNLHFKDMFGSKHSIPQINSDKAIHTQPTFYHKKSSILAPIQVSNL